MKKTELGWGLPWWAAIAGLESLIVGHGELGGERVEVEEKQGRGRGGCCLEGRGLGGTTGKAAWGGTRFLYSCSLGFCAPSVVLREVEEKEKGEKPKKKKEKEKKERKTEIFFVIWKLTWRKIKVNLWSCSNFFLKRHNYNLRKHRCLSLIKLK
jgi:hypothetical protein